jgi:hypothetical protein
MTDEIYPKLHDDKIKIMLDKQKALCEKLAHYKKIKKKWSTANTVLKSVSISVSCLLAGAAILTVTPFAFPVVAAILSGLTIGNTTLGQILVEGFTTRRKKYFQQKCDHINNYLNKMETLFIKCQEDGKITLDEFEQYQKLVHDFEKDFSLQTEFTSKEFKNIEEQVKKDVHQEKMRTLYNNILKEHQQKFN